MRHLPRTPRHLASYRGADTLEDVLSTFEARARLRLRQFERRLVKRRRAVLVAADALYDSPPRVGRKPSLNEYEGHE